jgi:hypothetical protein
VNRRLRWLAPLALGGLLAACGGAATKTESGVVTGVATPCVSVARTEAQIAKIPVRVTIMKGSTIIATKTVRGDHTYRFTVPSGHYIVISDALGGARPVSVNVNAGDVVRANLYSVCQ